MQRRYIYGRRSRTRITEPGPGQWHIAPAVTRPVRTAPGAPSHADGLRKKSRTVTAGQGCPRRRSGPSDTKKWSATRRYLRLSRSGPFRPTRGTANQIPTSHYRDPSCYAGQLKKCYVKLTITPKRTCTTYVVYTYHWL